MALLGEVASRDSRIGTTVEDVLASAEHHLALLFDIFELSLAEEERPLSHERCAALMTICRAQFATLQDLRRQLPAEGSNVEVDEP